MENTTIIEIVNLWKKLEVLRGKMSFSCGGDSMGDYDFHYETKNGIISNDELTYYFDSEVYINVEFYEDSFGNYIGESGFVYIELLNDDFVYTKESTEEHNEILDNVFKISFSDEQADFFKKYVRDIIGGFSENPLLNYKTNFIMTDEIENIEKEIIDLVYEETIKYEPEIYDGRLDDWFSYEANSLSESNELNVLINNSVIVYK